MTALPGQRVTCFAPAKINLALHVTGQRSDGYHELESLVVFCDVGDRLALTFSDPQSGSTRLDFSGQFGAALKEESDNLVLRACEAFSAKTNKAKKQGSPHFHLEKHLPVSSGIGGGSADAAAALLCLAKAAGDVAPDALAMIAAGLGADVPMCLYSCPLIARGIGDEIRVLENFPELHLVLVNPCVAVFTPDVFKRLASRNNPPLAPLPNGLTAAALAEWLAGQRNDLQSAAIAIAPEIAEILDTLERTAPLLARMSGSGATCFGLYGSAGAAQTAADTICAAHPDWWVKATKTKAFGWDRAKKVTT